MFARRQGKRWNKPIATPTSTMIPRKRIECLGKGNKSRNSETTRGEVIHFRARRGQATDSHSLVEKVRRQRINSIFKRLQDIVPDYGMSVMLDEIINYVQSLQNQVEFLSMELASSASLSYVFNSNGDHSIARNIAPQHQTAPTRVEGLNTTKWFASHSLI